MTVADRASQRRAARPGRWWMLGSAAVLLLLLPASCRLAPRHRAETAVAGTDSGEAGWVELFDGATLSGWRASENPATWTVEGGALTARGPRSHLFYVGDGEPPVLTDLELEVEVMTQPKANSGVYVHTTYQETGWPAAGIECQVNNTFPPDPRRTGSIYGLADLTEVVAQDGVWWTMRIAVRGNQVSVFVNGLPVNTYAEPEAATPRRLGGGTIALQGHDPDSVVHYRRVRLRRPGPAAGEPPPAPPPAGVEGAPDDAYAALAQSDFDGDRKAAIAIEDALAVASESERLAGEQRLLDILADPRATYAAKDAVCRLLRRFGSAASIPALARCLGDAQLAHMARYALERPDDPAAAAALRAALPSLQGVELAGAVASLGRLRDAAAVPSLAALLQPSPPVIRAAAAMALGEIGTPAAVQALQAALADTVPTAAPDLYDGLLRAAESALAAGRRDDALALYRFLHGPGQPVLVRIGALDGLVRILDAASVPLLLDTLSGSDTALQAVAVQTVRDLRGDGITAALAAQLPRLPAVAQAALIDGLAARGDVAAAPSLRQALASPHAAVRQSAAVALGRLGCPDDVVTLARFAAASRGSERDAARDALFAMPGETIAAELAAAVGHGEAGVRAMAIQTLGRRGVRDAGALVLDRASADSDADVRLAAIEALPALSDRGILPRVVALLAAASDGRESEAAQAALVALCSGSGGAPAGVDVVMAAAAAASEARLRAALLRVLGRLGGGASIWLVEAALADSRPGVADAAVRALCDWPDAAALPLLLAQSRGAADLVHRVLCIRAAVRLLEQRNPRPPVDTLEHYAAILAMAERADERRLVLSALAGTALPEAVPLVEPLVRDPEVGPEAAIALARLAKGIAVRDRELAAKAARAALAAAADESVRREAQDALDLIESLGDILLDWRVAGPFVGIGVKREELHDTPFAPEAAVDSESVTWLPMPVGGNPEKPWLLDLKEAVGGENRVAYLLTHIHLPESSARPVHTTGDGMRLNPAAPSRRARLELGSDDTIKVWLNGRRVHANPVWRGVRPYDDTVPVTLYPGWNRLLLKIVQGGGDWGACARLTDWDGGRIPGLRVSADLTAEQQEDLVPLPPPEVILALQPATADGAVILTDATGRGVEAPLREGVAATAASHGSVLAFDGIQGDVRADASWLPVEPGASWSINQLVYLEAPMADLTIVAGFGDVASARPVGCQRYLIQLRDSIHFWGSNVDVSAGVPFAVNRWQMITITCDGSTLSLYRDGELLTAAKAVLAQAAPVARLAPLDHWGKGNRFAGRIAAFSIWNGALSAADVKALAETLLPEEDKP